MVWDANIKPGSLALLIPNIKPDSLASSKPESICAWTIGSSVDGLGPERITGVIVQS